MINYTVEYVGISHVGKKRTVNQDVILCNGQHSPLSTQNTQLMMKGIGTSKQQFLVGVFDGMGGGACGEIAANMAAQEAASLKWKRSPDSLLKRYCEQVNDKIYRYAQKNGYFSMGTTCAVMAFSQKNITICNVGDSKIFRFSDGGIRQVSEDHVVELPIFGRRLLSQNLGIPKQYHKIRPYISQGNYFADDIYLICSDGLTDVVGVQEMRDIMYNTKFDQTASVLYDRALIRGASDDISIVLCRIRNSK